MIERRHKRRILQYLDETPAVALLGPRQVGKTTLAIPLAPLMERLESLA